MKKEMAISQAVCRSRGSSGADRPAKGHDIGIIRFTGKIGTDSLSDIPDYFWMWNWMWP